ncbi:MAG: HEAT repeat domain-containing protein, partial [Thermoguttaceae bacterium]|nr:HEAT repeat domain-containing protein [Thermoguttaceae bacterium]
MKKIQYMLALLFVLLPTFGLGQEKPSWTSDNAWNFIPKYEYGNDCAPLLLVENEVEESTADLALSQKLAARLAALLNDKATPAGRQFIFLQLRLVGTKAQVPLLAKYLLLEVDAENARLALENIQGEESLAALRDALKTTKGRVLIGVIGSLGKRKDAKAIDALAALAAGSDVEVANAAVNALGKYGAAGREALAKVKVNPKVCKVTRGNACRQAALEYAAQGKTEQAKAIYEKLTAKENRRGIRRAGFEGLLSLIPKDKRAETIEAWYADSDEIKATIAANHVAELSRKQLDALYKKINSFNEKQKVAFLEYYVSLPGTDLFKDALAALKSDNPLMQRTGIVMLGRIHRSEAIEPLLALVVGEQSPAFQQQISDALATLPDEKVAEVLLKALENDAKRDFALKVLAQMKYYKAIDAVIVIAQNPDKAIHGPALIALGQLCDADEFDVPRMLKLYLNCKDPAQQELVARQITVICKKSD